MALPLPSRRIVLLLAATALALMTIDARGFGPFRAVRSAAITVTQPARDLAGWVISPVADTWQGAVHYDDLAEENDELRRRIAELEGRIDGLPDVEAELAQLRLAADVESVDGLEQVTATVVADRSTGLERIIEIDRGSDHGLGVGMPVVVATGMVGRVELTTGSHAEVLLISDPRFDVGVVSTGTRAIGVVAGGGEGNLLVLDLEEGAAGVVSEGARFETSGLERSIYPRGIPVGRLVVDGGTLALEPFADLERLAFVTVLLTEGAS